MDDHDPILESRDLAYHEARETLDENREVIAMWILYEGTYVGRRKVQADLSCWQDYVISHRPQNYNVSYRPTGQHVHVGTFETLEAAKAGAEAHHRAGSPEVPPCSDSY